MVGIQSFRMTALSLPERKESINVGVKQEYERIAERDMPPTHRRKSVHTIVKPLEESPHCSVVALGHNSCVFSFAGLRRISLWTDRARHQGGRIGGSPVVGVSIRIRGRHVEPGTEPRLAYRLLRRSAIAHEVSGEEVQCSTIPVAQVGASDRSGVLSPIPVMQGEFRVDAPQ